MDRDNSQSFARIAEEDIASARCSLLIIAQTGDASHLAIPRRKLAGIKTAASAVGQTIIANFAAEGEVALDGLAAADDLSPKAVYAALDIVARIEAALWQMPRQSDLIDFDVAGFVDASFDEWISSAAEEPESEWTGEAFEIDEETLDIFRSEAGELLTNIADNLRVLSDTPADQSALWDIRRNAHTFKGAAGIVGLKEACETAHRMEDLLDKMVEKGREPVPEVISFLDAAARRLISIVEAKNLDDDAKLDAHYADVMEWLSSSVAANRNGSGAVEKNPGGDNAADGSSARGRADMAQAASTPIVRVSLDRLDELIDFSRGIRTNHSALAEKFSELSIEAFPDSGILAELNSIFEAGWRMTDEMHAKLAHIRMVRFGTIETRLSRAVHATCIDEKKKAAIEMDNGDVEIDTLIIDALIEPLMHLLKNAVVHGIEPPETRRLIGKPEIGNIRVALKITNEILVLSVTDDGGGISIPKLKEKAIAGSLITKEAAAAMNDEDAMRLTFDRGLTTAERIDLNAGRGIGMSIVKESVESRGGVVLVESEPQRGTTFTILMPLSSVERETALQVSNPLESADGPKRSTPLVLIVEDSASVRRQTAKLVEAEGLRAITAENGAEALDLLLSGAFEPDLILSDVEMPHIDGWELLEYLKTDDKLSHIPIVMLTSLDSDEHRQRAYDLGALAYLIKPFVVQSPNFSLSSYFVNADKLKLEL